MAVCVLSLLSNVQTVYEHLEFFGKLKGILLGDLHAAVMTAIDEVQLRPKTSTKSSSLSGGQRRRLSLAIALIGDSKIVFLDEPTSGVDVSFASSTFAHHRRAVHAPQPLNLSCPCVFALACVAFLSSRHLGPVDEEEGWSRDRVDYSFHG